MTETKIDISRLQISKSGQVIAKTSNDKKSKKQEVKEMNVKPENINILGHNYSIVYVDKPSEVDIFKRESLWGQVDYWTHTIRIYENDRTKEQILHTLIHEVLHVIAYSLKLRLSEEENHDELDLITLALADTFTRNNWFKENIE